MSSTSLTPPPTASSVPDPTTAHAGDAASAGSDDSMLHRVAGEAPAQATRVIDDAKSQLSDAAHRSIDDVRSQAEDRTAQAARGLRNLSTQVDALVAGRPDEAGKLTGIAQAVGQHATDFADRLDGDGLQGLVDDASRFGRRHPWAFLGLSVGAGFMAGRLVRTSAAVAKDEHGATSQSPSADASTQGAAWDTPAVRSSSSGQNGLGFEA